MTNAQLRAALNDPRHAAEQIARLDEFRKEHRRSFWGRLFAAKISLAPEEAE